MKRSTAIPKSSDCNAEIPPRAHLEALDVEVRPGEADCEAYEKRSCRRRRQHPGAVHRAAARTADHRSIAVADSGPQ